MKDASDVPVQQLVVDSGAFLKRAPLQELAAEVYATSGVINELKCDKSRHLIESLPFKIILQEPSVESLRIITDFSKKTGDYPSLSAVDLKVLALLHDLHIQAYGIEQLDYECKRATTACEKDDADEIEKCVINASIASGQSDEQCNVGDAEKMNVDNDDNEKNHGDDGDDDSDGGAWINEENVNMELRHFGEICLSEKDMKVACITTDFAMQNVILRLGMNLLSIGGYRIRRLSSYILRCRACFATTKVMTKRFCARCGNDALHRVAVTVNHDGTTELHINWQRLQSTRGLKYSLPAPKGGKHGVGPQLFEDQRMPQNRLAKCHIDPIESGPFVMKDVTSRSAVLGIRSLQKESQRRNVNSRTRGRKRGNKRR